MGRAGEELAPQGEIRRIEPGAAHFIDHSHPELEFNLVLQGRGTLFVPDDHHDLHPGMLVWLLPDQPHRLLRSPDLDMWVVSVPPRLCDDALLADVARYPARQLSVDDAVALDRLLTHISQDSDEPHLYHCGIEYAVRSARHAALTSAGPARKQLHPAVLKALLILRNSEESPSAGELAALCGINQDYLGQLLQQQTGRGFVEWRNRARLERFHIVYPESGDLLTAALAAGFGSYTQFHRVFVDLVGTTPGEWAKHGTEPADVALPSAHNLMPRLDGGSTRMIWYALAALVLNDTARWLDERFAGHLLRDDPLLDGPIPSHVASIADLERHVPLFVEEVRERDPDTGERLARAFERNDVFATQERVSRYWGLGSHDLAHVVTLYLAMAWSGSNLRPVLSAEQGRALSRKVRHALHAARSFEAADPAERARAAAAFSAQMLFLRNALMGARASGNEKIRQRVSDAAHRAGQEIFRIDLRQTPLI